MSTSRFLPSIAVLGSALGLASCGGSSADDIVRVSRQNNSGTYAYFQKAVLGKEREFKAGSVDQSGSKDVVELVGTTPSAIGYSGMAYATPAVKTLKVSAKEGDAGVAPTVSTAQDGSYPIARPLILYLVKKPEGAIKDFLDYINSDDGQKVVADIGYVPMKGTGPWKGPEFKGEASITVTGSDTMINVAQKWAEEYRKKNDKVSVQVAGGGSGVGIAALEQGKCDMATASRSMKAAEKARAKEKFGNDPIELIVGKDAVAVYVHKDNALDQISIDQLAEIYGQNGSITKWSQLSSATATATKQ